MSPAAENVIERLDGARQKWWLFSLLTTAVLAASLSLAAFLVLIVADALLKFSQGWLQGLTSAWLLLSGVLAAIVARRLLGGQRSLEAAARRVEAEFPELGNSLINLVQLSEDAKNDSPAFREAAIREAAVQIGDLPLDRAATRESRPRRLLHCMQTPRDLAESLVVLVLLIAIAAFCQSRVPAWGSTFSRLSTPWKFVPSVGSVKIVRVTPGNAEVLVGETVEIVAEIENPAAKPHQAWLFVAGDAEPEAKLAMTADKKRLRYRATVPSVLKPFRYRLEIGDSQTVQYSIGVREKPVVENAEITFRYPAYLGRKDETVRQTSLDIEAPQYTVASLRLRPSTPVAKGFLEMKREQFAGRVEEEGRLLTADLPMLDSGTYLVRLFNDAGHTDRSPRQNRVTVVRDAPPTVELLKPARQSTAAPGAKVVVVIRAGDDHGLGRLQLEMKLAEPGSADAEATVVQQWSDFPGDSTTTAVRQHRLQLKRGTFKPGQTVLIRAVAWDRRAISDWGLDLKPQETAGSWHSIKIVAEEVEAAAALQQLDGLREAIWKLLEKQLLARSVSSPLLSGEEPGARGQGSGVRDSKSQNLKISKSPDQAGPHPNPLPKGEGTKIVGDVRARQIEIQKQTAELVKSIGSTDRKERLTTKRVLSGLAFGEMVEAVAVCDALLRGDVPPDLKEHRADVPSAAKRQGKSTANGDVTKERLAAAGTVASAAPALQLIASQDRIIDVLRKLLDVARLAQADMLAEMKERPGGNLPDDAKHTLEEIRKKLDKFLAEQKKIIEASENLAKTPVEDFAAKEEELLKRMAAAEDDWAKFINDLHSDLSKLPEQDFANSSMAKELVEIQTELKMAEDALLKKSADIAVPLEQLGYERAEELKTNFEKWLPDTPDREKWSQEESLTDKDKEAPMAELPTELEDMVGDLMEKEEDLFDEMEDVSSSAADSLDKGAGWDATDGPISNMSAKGVTGNRLPNTSEIGGRSGEGRQGKSSGEYVGDEAVGKGGRKTPSRLTPDPIVKGQIKDHSKQSAGGATGGGKESGKGGEGLEGPAPGNPGRRSPERLAAKQAVLRNKAQGIDLKFQVADFHHTDLKKMIEVMAQVERDVKAGRYQNALRQRKVLAEGFRNVKQYLEGEFEVRKDTTSNLPADIQKEILGAMQDPSPAGWEELNRQYFDRLSHDGEK
ncbi:MAG: hypothetical protein WCB27_08635 [Thermoguttaceae bacterium]